MKNLFLFSVLLCTFISCHPTAETKKMPLLRNGFYEVVKQDSVTPETPISGQQLIVSFDSVFNPGDGTLLVIDTSDFVPLELEHDPDLLSQEDNKKLLSVSLTPSAAEKMKSFSQQHVMKHIAILLDGKVLTMHRIKEAITGPNVQITRCDDNGCEYLFVKLRKK